MNVINWEQLKYILLIHSDPFCYQRESIIYKNSFVVSEKMQFLNVQNRQKELGSNTFFPDSNYMYWLCLSEKTRKVFV